MLLKIEISENLYTLFQCNYRMGLNGNKIFFNLQEILQGYSTIIDVKGFLNVCITP